MPTVEYSKKEQEEAIFAGKILQQKCGHSRIAGECLLFGEMCYYENQKDCPEFS